MNEKKIEPTAAMVRDVECWRSFTGTADRTPLRPILRAALNHPDAPGLFADEDALRAAREEGWDQATRWIDSYQGGPNGRTDSARSANPHRPAQELPTEGGTIIVANDGHDDIEATGPVSGATWRTKEAVRGSAGRWYGVWRLDAHTPAAASAAPEHITPGTWKVDDQ